MAFQAPHARASVACMPLVICKLVSFPLLMRNLRDSTPVLRSLVFLVVPTYAASMFGLPFFAGPLCLAPVRGMLRSCTINHHPMGYSICSHSGPPPPTHALRYPVVKTARSPTRLQLGKSTQPPAGNNGRRKRSEVGHGPRA